MTLNKNISFIIIASISLIFISCNNVSDNNVVEDIIEVNEVDSDDVSDSQLLKELDIFILKINIPNKIYLNMLSNGYVYNKSILNKSDNIIKYSDSYSKAINLGIYGSDMNYSVCNDKASTAFIYLKNSRQLNEELGIPVAFDRNIIHKYEENIDNKDTLLHLVLNSYVNVCNLFISSDQLESCALVATGSWLEALYIVLELYDDTKINSEEVDQFIYNQKSQIKNVIDVLNNFMDNNRVEELKNDIKSIENKYKEIDSLKQIDQLYIENLKEIVKRVRDKQI